MCYNEFVLDSTAAFYEFLVTVERETETRVSGCPSGPLCCLRMRCGCHGNSTLSQLSPGIRKMQLYCPVQTHYNTFKLFKLNLYTHVNRNRRP